ncbi:MAG: TrkA family potassium uptake protein [Candidatus Melainabacteria bacterium]|mgnify:CR=1 FL=1|jgi:trk system potassium uptake protein|nr:TrkA family potassium uptake protein [Candidatus Melainabacteria bacterium]
MLERKQNFLVIGLGRFGSNVAKVLYENGHDVLGVDNEASEVQSIIDQKLIADAIQLDCTDANNLKKLDLDKFDAAVVAIGSSIEGSVLVAANLKEFGVNKIIAKASSTMHGKILERLGVDTIVYPEAEMGRSVARQLLGLNFLEEFALNDNFSIAELALPKKYAGQTMLETDIRSEHHLNILAIRRSGGHFSVSPSANTSLQKDDYLLVLGTGEDIGNFKAVDS